MVLVAASATGCGSEEADCTSAVRYEGRTYEQAALTYERDEKVGTAAQAWCGDDGNVFDKASVQVDVWSLPGFEPSQVLVYPVSDDLFQVLIADDVSKTDRTVILQSDAVNADDE